MKNSNSTTRPWDDAPSTFPVFDWTESEDVLSPLFIHTKTGSARRNSTRELKPGPLEVFPGIYSWDWDYQRFLHALGAKLTEAFPRDVDEYGRVGASGVRSNFLGLYHLPGAPMSPATFVLGDNRKKRSDAGLVNEFQSDFDEQIFRGVIRCFFNGYSNDGLRISKGTSSGIPFFQTKMTDKIVIARNALADLKRAGDMIAEGDHEQAYRQTCIGGATYVVFRDQMTDAVTDLGDGLAHSKDRMVADELYARTGGREGSLFASSKSLDFVVDAGYRVHKGMSATRRRVAQAMGFQTNAILMAVAQPCRQYAYDKYSFAYHHTTRLQKQDKVQQFDDLIALDVSDHDTFWPVAMIGPVLCDELADLGYSDQFISVLEQSFRLPVYITTPSQNPEECHKLIGDWRKPSLLQGLSSGTGVTDIMGTILMTFCYLDIQLRHIAPDLKEALVKDVERRGSLAIDEFLSRYLNGELAIAQMSKSDDALILSKGGVYGERTNVLREKLKNEVQVSPYMQISYEDGYAFLGDVLVYDSTRSLSKARFTGNIVSYVSNLFVPEYSIDGDRPRHQRRRPFPGISHGTAPEVFGSSPIWQEVNDIIEKVWYEVYGTSFRRMRQAQYDEDVAALSVYVRERTSQLRQLDLSLIDAEVLADPSKLSWKYGSTDVHPSLVELFTSGLSSDETQSFSEIVKPS
nr:MAG: putative RNA-dependent RNA polymerase [Guangxi cysto-like virus 5]